MKCHKIGETFRFQIDTNTIVKLIVKDDNGCIGCERCYFRCCPAFPPEIQDRIEPCTKNLRPDNTDVHFEEVK